MIEVEETIMTTTCTALIPVSPAMDVQAINILKQINQPVCNERPKINPAKRAMASIRATSDCICMEGALNLLKALGYEKDVIYKSKQKWDAADLVNDEFFPELQGRMAYETGPLWFWGGPPGKTRWYKGTLQTLLNDRVLCEIDSRGVFKIAELIGTDLGELKHANQS
jgi:hypothetical protein